MATPPSHCDSPSDATADPTGSTQEPTDATTPERPSSHNASTPGDNCAICLGRAENKAFPDGCYHHFCFSCLVEWSKVKAACPLCLQPFKSIIHNVRSDEDHDRYIVREQPRSAVLPFGGSARTLLIPVQVVPRGQFMQRRQEREGQPQLPYVTLPNQYPNISRRPVTSSFRLQMYLSNLWAVPHIPSSRHVSPELYRANPHQVERLVPWINRELNALMERNETRVSAASNYVLSLILNLDIRHPDFSQKVQPLLIARTEHFVHEFYSFASSMFETMDDYDRHIVYASRSLGWSEANPVDCFTRVFLGLTPASAPRASAAPVVTYDPRQPRSGGRAVLRVPVVASRTDNDSNFDRSNCFVVTVPNPFRNRTPEVFNEDNVSASDIARPCDQGAGPSNSSCPSDDRTLDRRATSDSFSRDENA
ncbi:E3 ubiquitin-protein ligase Topors [Rhipicephalus sanguineus]|uniref:E3 ubiquitin-protein ligase Topors n=1 Tax=Rhipicephalus sanguineus TaxID=34632 RepID=A0A9D4T928_RHISA|nr:E3 ubiquitin-protein ligase Topors [Rhipicephalus sanguineus]KAH7983101.1 hypothetical protein HPB52_009268 [Rhipicephalus sanguineus]